MQGAPGESCPSGQTSLLSPCCPHFCSFVCSYDTSRPEAYWDPQDEIHRVKAVRVPNYSMWLPGPLFLLHVGEQGSQQ